MPSPERNATLSSGRKGPAPLAFPSSGDIHVIDVSNFAAPHEVAFFHLDGAGTHNFSVDEVRGILYAAYYNGGVRAIDITGDLSSCAAADKSADGRCDLAQMGRELAHGPAGNRAGLRLGRPALGRTGLRVRHAQRDLEARDAFPASGLKPTGPFKPYGSKGCLTQSHPNGAHQMNRQFRGAAFAAAPFLIGSTAHAQNSGDYTAPRNAVVDAAGARSVEVEAGAGSLRVEGKAGLRQVQVTGTARSSSQQFLSRDQADRRAAGRCRVHQGRHPRRDWSRTSTTTRRRSIW